MPTLIPIALASVLWLPSGFDGVSSSGNVPASSISAELPKSCPVRLMGYHAAARELGVDVGHLWRVVHGERQSKRLTARLRAANIQLGGK